MLHYKQLGVRTVCVVWSNMFLQTTKKHSTNLLNFEIIPSLINQVNSNI